MRRAETHHCLELSRRRGFVLLEVLITLVILGVSTAALMRSFTLSLKAARMMEVQTQSMFFAHQLLHEFELFPPDKEGKSEGGFGDDYRFYSYRVEVTYVTPKYEKTDGMNGIEQYFSMRQVRIEIVYNDGEKAPYVPLSLDAAITGFEKFSLDSRKSYLNF